MATVPVDEALARILEAAVPLRGAEVVDVHGACGRVLAADVLAGCDLPPHDASTTDGYALRAADAARGGLSVSGPLRVAVIATGRELAPPGTPLGPGQVFDANRAQLHALLGALGCEVQLGPAIGDDAAQTRAAIRRAARDADLVITSGGVGVGDEDHVRAALETLGEVRLQGVAMKPGKPLLFGRAGSADVFGLPGNPAALLVGFCLFVRPFVLRRFGATACGPRAFPVRADFEACATAGRRGYLMARLEPASGGGWSCRTHADASSGAMVAATWADGLAVVPEATRVVPGDTVGFLPFSELLG